MALKVFTDNVFLRLPLISLKKKKKKLLRANLLLNLIHWKIQDDPEGNFSMD